MKKLIAVMVGVLMVGGSVAQAEDERWADRGWDHSKRTQSILATTSLGGWGAVVASATGGLLESIDFYSGVAWIPAGIVVGTIREIQTNPRKRGLYRYNRQDGVVSEDRKWELDPALPQMKRLKGYVKEEARIEPVIDTRYPLKWKRGAHGLMQKV